MEQFLGTEYPPDERVEFLESNSNAVEKKGYMKRFSPEEIEQMRIELADVSIKINDINEEKADAMKAFKETLKPLFESMNELLHNIKTKSVFVEEKCFKIVDLEAHRTGYYNSEGYLVEERPSTPDEMQLNIFSIKTGTDN